ncbi:hypothetical protein ABGB18_03570 [Nonomuraea sp. B12E4]|uniref:hypothetical protein n=1 Tax=Nonomuraea sp. B12E4 TaxID=3153564 RepID=UPI00325CA279
MSRTKITTLQGLHGLGAVTELHMHCARLTSLDGIAAMPALRHLTVQGLDLADFTPFAGVLHLEQLHVASCPKLTDLRPLAGLPSIKEVYVSQCPALPRHVLDGLSARGLLLMT